ncbi:hypothetical protein DFQ11_10327 [Winogradskyella epiphytica]|uniref:DUF2116 family Zn-ribbon domain-containing protein n=1 Tax=Winogradskyella epiphytica TaxID=262005 RepID=A0A2V4YCF7_9FLAO|nr:hypothetical protein [Winogradskyella epiphytica]PYE80947.1 hypothetical protein DFQ11_10327 [Winogradskyella epiphytica]GGW65723.1 hypothetical protein GCM10008085_16910 [Winogradskyella epiphytica]
MLTNKKNKTCKACDKILIGRSDKKFCNANCKSAYHYGKYLEETPKFYYKVDRQLKKNRRILKSFNKAGKATVRCHILLEMGFNPNFFTHFWKNKKNDVYLFVYEYGFLKKVEKGTEKYILVKWQDYMFKK